jgi:hypothetical protein
LTLAVGIDFQRNQLRHRIVFGLNHTTGWNRNATKATMALQAVATKAPTAINRPVLADAPARALERQQY